MARCLRGPTLCRRAAYLLGKNSVSTVQLRGVSSVYRPLQLSCQQVPHLRLVQSTNLPDTRAGCFGVQRSVSSSSSDSDRDVSYAEMLELIQDKKNLIVDVREPYEREQTGLIGESIGIPLGDLYSAFSLPKEAFTERYKTEKPGKDSSNVILHCMSGMRSNLGLDILKSIGYDKVRHFPGGWKDWAENKGIGVPH